MTSRRRTIAFLSVVASIAALAGCGLSLRGDLAVPSGVVATTDRTDLIEVSWLAVPGADVYYVYRSLSADGPFAGVPHRTVTQLVLLDADIDPTSYYYTVSAGRLSTGAESGMSTVVKGTMIPEEIAWQDASVVFGAPGTVRLALDRTTPTVQAYLLTVADDTGATASVRQIEADGALTALGSPSEATDGTDTRVADLAAAGHIYVALVAEGPDEATDTDRVFLYRYDSELEEWEWLQGITLAQAHASAPFVTLAALDADDLLISYRGADGAMVVYRYDGTLAPLTSPSATDDETGAGDPSIGMIDAASVPGAAALLYELEDDDPDPLIFGDTVGLMYSEWGGGDWSAPAMIYDGSAGNLDIGGAGITIDPTVTPSADGTTVVHLDPAGLHLKDASGATVTGSDTGFTGIPNTDIGSVAVAAQEGVISVFYLDLAENSGVVAQFDTVTPSWTESSPADFTQSAAPTDLALRAGGGKLFSAFDDDGITRVRVYQ